MDKFSELLKAQAMPFEGVRKTLKKMDESL
jgi:hypothetical protein